MSVERNDIYERIVIMSLKVIFHIDEMPKWGLLLTNVRNLVQAKGEAPAELEVVANSEAVKLYEKARADSLLTAIGELSDRGVRFVACNNALKALGIKREQLLPGVSIVPAGVLELAEKQAEGYAYIKP